MIKTCRRCFSTTWYHRHINDTYVKLAHKNDLRSRASFKLTEINDKYHLIRSGSTVIDLGCAPGSWSESAAEIVYKGKKATNNENPPKKVGQVIGIDLIEMDPIEGVDFIQGDFTDTNLQARLIELMRSPPDCVISDMSPQREADRNFVHIDSLKLSEIAIRFAEKVLTPNGSFLCKFFDGERTNLFKSYAERSFSRVKIVKPSASRSTSSEKYLLAMGFKSSKSEK